MKYIAPAKHDKFIITFFDGDVVEGYWRKFSTPSTLNTTVEAEPDDPEGHYCIIHKATGSNLGCVIGCVARPESESAIVSAVWEAFRPTKEDPYFGSRLVPVWKHLDDAVYALIDAHKVSVAKHQAEQASEVSDKFHIQRRTPAKE